ncbi:spore maturation protein [Candidatus Synchoanobacter obligatus]|uniref:Spore maturation protein n=1 Tax=Candidatus Synchoanobacter obligatus TaxID=2919597 RepID=A0ABT1L539_9GAMM|nr:nucleoside recognition domain-containing protein [Candidatus Synchoanobacter obligatus]MCP8352292.1 spore maturation protein [Candidatus Synchoanobacter obligatus]
MIQLISNIALLSIILGIPLIGLIKRVPIFESFITGGKQGFNIIINIMPFIIGMFLAIEMLQASGFFTILQDILPFHDYPPEIIPLALIRPITGSGTIAVLIDIIDKYGPDSLGARTAATILGSTETTFYVIAVYFGAIKVKHYRHAITVGLIADLAGFIASILICGYMFGSY